MDGNSRLLLPFSRVVLGAMTYRITVALRLVDYCKVVRVAGVQGHLRGSEGLCRGLSTWLC
jgi:hypothetical protein